MTATPHLLDPAFIRRERTLRKFESALAMLRADDVMTRRPLSWPSAMSLGHLASQVVPRVSWSSFPTHDERGHLDGLVVIDRSLDLEPLVQAGLQLRDVAIARERLVIVRPDTTLFEILTCPIHQSAGRVIVLGSPYQPNHPEPLLGIITPADLGFHLGRMSSRV